VVNSGTTSEAVLDFELPRAPAVTVGTVSTVDPDDPATVADVGADGDVVLDFGIPQGVKGDKGDAGDTGATGAPGAAATVDVGTVTVVDPDQSPDVTNAGTTSDAVLDFDLPRAPAVTVGTVTTVDPDDPAAVTDSGSDGDVVLDFDIPRGEKGDAGDEGPSGPDGPPGVVISPTEPDDTDLLWADTSEPGDAVVPLGGLSGQSLVKASGSDYDTEWADRVAPADGLLVVEHDGDDDVVRPTAGAVYWKGSVAPENAAAGDLWYDTGVV
jgi:hypothetical protein